MQTNCRYVIVAVLAAFGCAKQPDRVESMVVQPVAAAEQSVLTSEIATHKEESSALTRVAAFADDGAGKLLSQLMMPGSPAFRARLEQKGPGERPPPTSIARPDPPATGVALIPATYPSPAAAELRRVVLAERVPADFAPLVNVPQRTEFVVAFIPGIPAPDAKRRVALPILARPTLDRASLEDPTADFTAQSIVNNKFPPRSTPAPFIRVNLPDPFENAEAVKVKTIIKEDPLTAVGNPPPPKR
jgi:hypothetical protein